MAEARRQSRIKVDDKAHDWITVGRSLLLLLFLFLSPLRPLRTASSIHLARSWLCGLVVVVDSFRLCLSFALSLSGLRSSSVDSPASILSRRTRHSRRQAIIARNHTTLPSSA